MFNDIFKSVFSSKAMSNRFHFFLCGITIFSVFFTLYFAMGMTLSKTTAFKELDVFFGIDTPRVINDITIFSADHYRSNVHPLYVLMMNPVGVLTRNLIGSNVNAAVLLNSFLGALGVLLGFIFFSLCTETLVDASLLAFLFGISASQLILSAVPHTASLATCSLLITYILCLLTLRTTTQSPPLIFLWMLAGVFSFGVATTNFVQTVICFGISSFIVAKRAELWHWGRNFLFFGGGFFSIALLLALLQKAAYPSTVLFFLPAAYQEDVNYISYSIFQSPLIVIFQILKQFLWVNLIAPYPTTHDWVSYRYLAVTFSRSFNFSVPGIIGSALLLLPWITYIFRKNRTWKGKAISHDVILPLTFIFALCLLFNMALHSFYGGERNEYFLYTGHFTFLALTLWAIPLGPPKKLMHILLFALIICMAFNNLLVVREIIGIYAGL